MRGTAATAAPDALLGRALLAPIRRSQVSTREVIAGVGGLGLLALLTCARHVHVGGFYHDDWSLIALARFPGHAGLLHGLWPD